MRQLIIPLNCSDKTCYNFKSKKMCNHYGTIGFGQMPVCRLFYTEDQSYTTLIENESNIVLRCKECLKREYTNKK